MFLNTLCFQSFVYSGAIPSIICTSINGIHMGRATARVPNGNMNFYMGFMQACRQCYSLFVPTLEEMLTPVRFSTALGRFSMTWSTSPVSLLTPMSPFPMDTMVSFLTCDIGAATSAASCSYTTTNRSAGHSGQKFNWSSPLISKDGAGGKITDVLWLITIYLIIILIIFNLTPSMIID